MLTKGIFKIKPLRSSADCQTLQQRRRCAKLGVVSFDVSPDAPLSMILATKILALIHDSGASQLEAFGALGAAREILPTLPGVSLAPNVADSADV